MSGKSILYAVLTGFLIFSLVKMFKTDTRNPNAVINRYFSQWESNNTTGMYPLLSQRAKDELRKQKVSNVTDYYGYFVDHRNDLSGYQITSQEINDNRGRYWVTLKLLDFAGREYEEKAVFFLVKQQDGWRVDSWEKNGNYALP